MRPGQQTLLVEGVLLAVVVAVQLLVPAAFGRPGPPAADVLVFAVVWAAVRAVMLRAGASRRRGRRD